MAPKKSIKTQSPDPRPPIPGPGLLILDRDSTLAAVEKIKSIVKKTSIMPVLKNALFEFTPGAVKVSATDLEISAVVTIPGTFGVETPSRHLLPGALVRDVLNKMQPGEIPVTISDDGEILFTQGGYEIAFSTLLVDDYPEIAVESGEAICTIEGKLLVAAINKVIYAASKDETRYALTGVAIQIKDEMLYTIATDGFRISVYRTPVEGAENTAIIIIPRRAMKLVSELFDNEGIVQISVIREVKDDGKTGEMKSVIFDGPNLIVISRLINQVYPDFEAVISFSDQNPARLCTVSTSFLVASLDRISIAAKEDPIILFSVSPGRIDLSVESPVAKAKDWIPATTSVEAISSGIAIGFLIDAFGHIATDRSDIMLPEGYGMIKIAEHPGGDDPPRHIQGIMPVRT